MNEHWQKLAQKVRIALGALDEENMDAAVEQIIHAAIAKSHEPAAQSQRSGDDLPKQILAMHTGAATSKPQRSEYDEPPCLTDGLPDLDKQRGTATSEPLEWTRDRIPACLEGTTLADWEQIADAHNAAVKAEQTSKNLMTQDALNLKQQLKAEREKRKPIAHAFESERELRKRYEDELAAEREKREDAERKLRITGGAYNALDEELAAEREKLQSWLTKYCYKDLDDVADELRKRCDELAAEREHYKRNIDRLSRELAAERERTFAAQQAALKEGIRYGELERSILDLSHPNCKQLLKDIAAEREKVKLLGKALQRLYGLVEQGYLVRDTSHDADPKWYLKVIELKGALRMAQDVLAKEGKDYDEQR